APQLEPGDANRCWQEVQARGPLLPVRGNAQNRRRPPCPGYARVEIAPAVPCIRQQCESGAHPAHSGTPDSHTPKARSEAAPALHLAESCPQVIPSAGQSRLRMQNQLPPYSVPYSLIPVPCFSIPLPCFFPLPYSFRCRIASCSAIHIFNRPNPE